MSHRNTFHEHKHPKIIVSKSGVVDAGEINDIVGIMVECYDRLEPHQIDLVDLYVFDRSSSVEAFMATEYKEIGTASTSLAELFFAMHDAWRGTSRIVLCLERMKKLPRLVQVGGIRHEVGHSVLHGSLRYYILPLPAALLDLVDQFDISTQVATNLLYLISIAVKDYEVSRHLYERGYVEDQVAYAKYLLAVADSDVLSWELSRGNPIAEILCLVSCLKPTCCAVPLSFDKTFGEEMKKGIAESLSYLPTNYSTPLLRTILEGFPSLGMDTFSNIEQMAFWIKERMVEPFYSRRKRAFSHNTQKYNIK